MMIKLFEVKNRMVIPSEHCYIIPQFKAVIDEYPEDHLKVLAYVFYMTCKNSENPYVNRPGDDLEEEILKDLEADFSTEDDVVLEALEKAKSLYETPSMRAYVAISKMLDNLAIFMETQEITDGRDGNITAMVSAAKNFSAVRKSFKEIAKDVEEESALRNRGGGKIAYDED